MLRILFFITFFLLVLPESMYTQEGNLHNSEEEETIKDPGLELIVSGLIIYAPERGLSDYGTEIHLTYWTSHTWAFGVGYTQVYEENGRVGHEVAGLISAKPWKFITTNFGPSLSLPNSHKDTELSAYLEGEFNFEIGGFHTGPLVGMLIGEEFKMFTGIHLGYDF